MNNQMQRLGMKTAAWQEIRHAIILLTDGGYRRLRKGVRHSGRSSSVGSEGLPAGSPSATLGLSFSFVKWK